MIKYNIKSIEEVLLTNDLGIAVKVYDIILDKEVRGTSSMSIPAESKKEAESKLVDYLESRG